MCPPRPLEPGGHAAELVVLLEQQHAAPGPRQHVGRRQPGQAAADDEHVVFVASVFEKVFGHAIARRPSRVDCSCHSRLNRRIANNAGSPSRCR